ncbi:MAG: helix-turn-helix transcriptional regulator [Candidatus Bathyarchaeia archaeon]|jgi:uncharacterized membrane protein
MLLMLLPINNANAQDYLEYKIQAEPDNAATWIITQVSDVTAPIDNWESFQTKIYTLTDNAATLTKRPMAIDENSLQINTTVSASSKTTEYMFKWQNFTVTQNGEETFGDVFSVTGFFMQLYGEASLQITYPPSLMVKSVTPEPNSQDAEAGTLRWYRTQDLENNPVKIVLTQNENTPTIGSQRPLLLLAVSSVGVAVILGGSFLVLKRRRQPRQVSTVSGAATVVVQSEEDKILNLLRSAKGSMRQSDITEQCRFSKAKTSQLLTALEKNGAVTRLKSGRDKIVTLNEGGKGEKQK